MEERDGELLGESFCGRARQERMLVGGDFWHLLNTACVTW